MPNQPPSPLTLDGAGVRLRGYDWGNPMGRPLVLVHGIEDFALALEPLPETFRDDYHVVAFDLRGHGDSDKPGAYTMGHFIADLHAVIGKLELDRPILIGHSLGGQIVSQYAGVFPEVPRAVVSIDGMGPPMKIPDPDSEEKQLRTREAVEGLLRAGGRGRPMADLEDATQVYLRFHPRLDPALARRLVEMGTEPHPHGGLQYKWDPRIHSLRLSSTPEIAEERFRWAECPVLLVSAGEVDEFMWRRRGLDPSTLRKDPEEIRRRMALFRDADHVEIAGAGHHIHFDQPAELIRVTREFLEKSALSVHTLSLLVLGSRPVSAPSKAGTLVTGDAAGIPSAAYSNYVLFVLFIVYVFNFIDRQILSILIDPIKTELGATDTQMGFLTGFAFAVFYTVAGIPIARVADHGVRRNLIAVGLAVWSAMTALSGAAQSFLHLALARIGVGVGEAAGSPPAHSLISDYFAPEKRATAISIYNSGIHVGVMLGYLAGGWINEFFSWRVAFLVVGVPGIVFALVVRFTVREPRRGMSEAQGTPMDTQRDSIKDVFRFMLSMRSFKLLSVATGIAAFSAYGFGSWVPSYLRRVHEMGSGEIGTWIGIEAGVGGAIGAIWGGRLADRLGARDPRWYLWVPALSLVAYLPFVYLFLILEDPRWALLAYFGAITFAAMHLGPAIAITYGLVKVRMRALASALLLFILNMIGLGLGPLLVGMISDGLAPTQGAHSIRYALGIVATSKVIAIWMFWSASKTLRKDLEAKNTFTSSASPA